MFSKILIANRGEIAVRIIRACKEMGIASVAVYSEADRDCLHVALADECVCIGPASPKDSYLCQERILSAALLTGAQAIHPGYGFLSENAEFAAACRKNGIAFIGPDAECMARLSDKTSTKEAFAKTALRPIPGAGVLSSAEQAAKEADAIGYPVMLKARSGGGGRGIRVIHSRGELLQAYPLAVAESEAAFGDGAVYLEKYVHPARHIEVQILADEEGHVVCLGERDCSVQRRHQKLLEESPSPAVDSETRTALFAAVADAVRRSGMSAANVWEYRSVSSVMTLRDGVLSPNEGFGDPVDVTLIPLADYNAAMGTDLTLPQGQVYVCRSRTGYQGTSLTLQNGPTWQLAGLLDNFSPSGSDSAGVVTQLWLIVPDLSAADALEQVMNRANMGVSRTWHYGFDLDRQLPDAADPVAAAIRRMAQDGGLMENGVLGVESLAENRGDFYGSYGSLFFLGILLSVGFSLAAVLIIYYKQISEGYEDQARFDIMQKVGMTRRDIRSSINSQLLLVFFLPLLLAGLHLAFAFPFVHKLLLLFNLWNTRLLVGTTAASFLAFAALYTLVYRITSNAYYHIVSGGGER